MTELRARMIADMQLRGLTEKTQECYVAGVRGLAAYYRRSPDELSEEELRAYLLYLVEDKQVSDSTFKIVPVRKPHISA